MAVAHAGRKPARSLAEPGGNRPAPIRSSLLTTRSAARPRLRPDAGFPLQSSATTGMDVHLCIFADMLA